MGNGRSSAARGAAPGTAHRTGQRTQPQRISARLNDRQPGAGMKMCTVSSLVFVVLQPCTGVPSTGRSRRAAPTRRRAHQTYRVALLNRRLYRVRT